MKSYELTYLISGEIPEEEAKTIQNKIASLIQKEEGVLGRVSTLLRKKLAYPIKKPAVHTHTAIPTPQTQAYLVVLDFQLNPENLANLEKELKQDSQILRYLILSKKTAEVVSKKIEITKPRRYIKKPKEATLEKKVELKEIEKKLEEILKE